jgi:hypothetical protein
VIFWRDPSYISRVVPADAWLMTSPLGTPRGRCDEYSSKVFPQLRNQGLIDQERSKQTTKGDADWPNNTPTRASFHDRTS